MLLDNPCRVCGVKVADNKLDAAMGFYLCRAHQHTPFAKQAIVAKDIENQRTRLQMLFGITAEEARQIHHVATLASYDAMSMCVKCAPNLPQEIQRYYLITVAIMLRDNAEFSLQQERSRQGEKAAGLQPGLPGSDQPR
jgi:hypothetical protein